MYNGTTPRAGCIDMWNAFMVKDAQFTMGSDIPICPCTADQPPTELISYEEAKRLVKLSVKQNPDFHKDAYVHFYIDDQKFDGKRDGIWQKPQEALEIIRHFSGIISPDFSTNADFPDPLKRYNTYRMRAFGYWISIHDIPVINNVRWGTEETWSYCFDGIPYNSIVAIGTVASGIHKLENRPLFERGLLQMMELLNPRMIIVYGSSNYSFFRDLPKTTAVIQFPSSTSLVFASKRGGDQNE
ncbi:MAG: DUF4417 domain-containing protein [Oscillospiraceae bacterium]|nr:DUF4417 domain-containing protein [Oscillospiraceae bacterium]